MFYLTSARLVLKSGPTKHRKQSDKWLIILKAGLTFKITIYLIVCTTPRTLQCSTRRWAMLYWRPSASWTTHSL